MFFGYRPTYLFFIPKKHIVIDKWQVYKFNEFTKGKCIFLVGLCN